MAFGSKNLLAVCWAVLLAIWLSSTTTALISAPDFNPPYPKAISDLKEAIVKALGIQSDDFKISGFDLKDALVGHTVSYEFDIEIDNKVVPFKLLEDVNRWEYVDLPIFQAEELLKHENDNGLVKGKRSDDGLPVLAPFQLAGPMELWIQDAKDMRLSLPHDVDAGVLKKVILAEGAVVTVKGARSVSLRHPVELPLPLNRTQTKFASGLLRLAEYLHQASISNDSPLLSLRIVGPTSLSSPSPPSSSPSSPNRLKLKRLAPGLVELSSTSKSKNTEPTSTVELSSAKTAILTPKHFTTMWPLTSINGSNSNLIGFESLLTSVLGEKANMKGSFKLLKADVSAQTFMKIGFGVENKLKEELVGFPEWTTRPETVRMHFEVLAKVDGDKVVAERVVQVDPVAIEEAIAPHLVTGNVSMSRSSAAFSPSNPFTL